MGRGGRWGKSSRPTMSGLTFHVRLEERATMDVCCLSLNFHARYGPNPFDCLKRRALGLRLQVFLTDVGHR